MVPSGRSDPGETSTLQRQTLTPATRVCKTDLALRKSAEIEYVFRKEREPCPELRRQNPNVDEPSPPLLTYRSNSPEGGRRGGRETRPELGCTPSLRRRKKEADPSPGKDLVPVLLSFHDGRGVDSNTRPLRPYPYPHRGRGRGVTSRASHPRVRRLAAPENGLFQ